MRWICLGLSMLAVACGGGGDVPGEPTTSSGGQSGAGGEAPTTFGGDRPVELHVPGNYDGSATPLLVLLHGFTASGAVQDMYFGLSRVANEHGLLYAFPDGTANPNGDRFWNATDACCDFFGSGVDDSAYLAGLIDDIGAAYNVDPKRIYVAGHSNGGFMAYRMACDHADKVAAVVSLAGATFDDPSDCSPSEPVHVLQIHGTDDATVSYDGGTFGASYPSAQGTVEYWAGVAGCDTSAPRDGGTFDVVADLAGSESNATVFDSGCQSGGSAALWNIPNGTHIPNLSVDFAQLVVDQLLAHPKP